MSEQRLIDGDKLYDVVENQYKDAIGEHRRGLRDALDYVSDAPTIDVAPVAQWISVKDRLPVPKDKYQVRTWVIVALKSGCVKEAKFEFYEPNQGFQSMASEVTHWRPLPSPPEEQP